nr:MAG TPA: hypothetical protein [Caudoviricetes sp.]
MSACPFLYHNLYFSQFFSHISKQKKAFRFLGKPHKIQFL